MVYNVLDFGAIADGKTLNSKAIQTAIDECTKDGGEVDGITFKDIDFVVQKEEDVEFTENKINSRGEYVLTVKNAKNVTLDGVRVIADQNTMADWKGEFVEEGAKNLTVKNCSFSK